MIESSLVVVAGASGALGRHVVAELSRRGLRVRALTRDRACLAASGVSPDEVHVGDAFTGAELTHLCRGADAVFSCLGASVIPGGGRGRKPFSVVDAEANGNLIEEARAAGVRKFVYVSVFGADRFGHLDYYRGHEMVVASLKQSGLAHTVIRPTGFFSAFDEILKLARRGSVPVFGDGSARSNPIHDADLAGVCADAVCGNDHPQEIAVGGPEILSRKALAALALASWNHEPKVRHIPPIMVRLAATLARPFDARTSALLSFFATATTHDLIAPAYGTQKLSDYFRTRVAEARGR